MALGGVIGAGKNGVESIWETQNLIGANGVPNSGSAMGAKPRNKAGRSLKRLEFGLGLERANPKFGKCLGYNRSTRNETVLYSGRYDGGPATGGFGATLPVYAPGTGLDQPYWNKKIYIGNDPAMRALTTHVTDGGSGHWINHRILRYADVILMLAEASNEMGDGATAAANLELVRKRARGSSTTALPFVAFSSQTQMRTAIKNERRWEFAMEGYRFYDLVRWNDAVNVLGSLGYTDRCKLYPIPQPAINSSNGVLVQNPLW